MKVKNWNLIEESTGGQKLPAGGYVCVITDVEDNPRGEYLRITYDIKEGEYAGHYSDDFAKDHPYIHQFVRSYKDSAEGMFKAFINRVQESNRGFVWNMQDERQFIGKEIGLVMQYEKYTNTKGEDKERLNVERVYATQDIRNGDYKLPDPKDNRTNVPASSNSYDDYSDVPFGGPSSNAPSWA